VAQARLRGGYTGAETLEALARDLDRKGIRLGLAGFRTEAQAMLERAGAMSAIGSDCVYPTLKSAMNAFLAAHSSSMTTGASGDNPTPNAADKHEPEPSNDPPLSDDSKQLQNFRRAIKML
jgi:hypothetical protein